MKTEVTYDPSKLRSIRNTHNRIAALVKNAVMTKLVGEEVKRLALPAGVYNIYQKDMRREVIQIKANGKTDAVIKIYSKGKGIQHFMRPGLVKKLKREAEERKKKRINHSAMEYEIKRGQPNKLENKLDKFKGGSTYGKPFVASTPGPKSQGKKNLHDMGIFMKVGKKRLPITRAYGISVADMWRTKDSDENRTLLVKKHAQELYDSKFYYFMKDYIELK